MRLLSSLFCLLLLVGVAEAGKPAPAPKGSKTDPEGFGKRTLQLYEAMRAGDATALDNVLGQNFIFSTFTGTTGSRAQYLEIFQKKLMIIDDFKLNPLAVQMYGDAAVVVYRLTIHAQVGGQSWPSELVSTDTWVRPRAAKGPPGQWELVARHSSAVTPMQPAAPKPAAK